MKASWLQTRIRRFGKRSARMPPNWPATSIGVNWVAMTRPTWKASWVSVRASQGMATLCIQVPTVEMTWPMK